MMSMDGQRLFVLVSDRGSDNYPTRKGTCAFPNVGEQSRSIRKAR